MISPPGDAAFGRFVQTELPRLAGDETCRVPCLAGGLLLRPYVSRALSSTFGAMTPLPRRRRMAARAAR
jgi:hypothetical protein